MAQKVVSKQIKFRFLTVCDILKLGKRDLILKLLRDKTMKSAGIYHRGLLARGAI
jgi:hypothetical protein